MVKSLSSSAFSVVGPFDWAQPTAPARTSQLTDQATSRLRVITIQCHVTTSGNLGSGQTRPTRTHPATQSEDTGCQSSAVPGEREPVWVPERGQRLQEPEAECSAPLPVAAAQAAFALPPLEAVRRAASLRWSAPLDAISPLFAQ